MATLQNIGKLKYRGKDGQWHPLPVVVQDTGGGVSTISGKGAPTSETQGEINQLYRDEDTQKLYICTATDGGYTWAEVSGGGSGGSVDVDKTLTQAGQAADAKAAGDAIGKKIDKAQGVENAGKILGIGNDGNVVPQDKPAQALAGASAPTTATAGVVGQEYYVIVGNAVTEMYVCTAVANGTYTWDRVEFGAEETDPTVPAWAKEAQKPSYTASEVGADQSGTAASQVSAHNTGTDTHSDIRLLISGLTDRLNALADSDDTTLDQLSEVVAYIKNNRTLIEAITTNKVNVADIIDNLTTNVTNKPLSAAQGVALKALIDAITIPEALPNPNALTFTGAVTGSYDGSAPLSVAIPSGGGSGGGGTDVALGMSGASVGQIAKITAVDESGIPTAWEPIDLPSGGGEDWQLIASSDTEATASLFEFNADNDGNSFSLKKAMLYVWVSKRGSFTYANFGIQKYNWLMVINSAQDECVYRVEFKKDVDGKWMCEAGKAKYNSTTYIPTENYSVLIGKRHNTIKDTITSVFFENGGDTTIAKYALYGIKE